jgi:superfamily II DNA or RNA helicase
MTQVIIRNLNEAYLYIQSAEHIQWELRDHFTFMVPGYQFTPQFRARLWDGKIRLFDVRMSTIYRGLLHKVVQFCEDRKYSYEHEELENAFSLVEAEKFEKKLSSAFAMRDYQLDAFAHAYRRKRALLVSPTASGKSLIIYTLMRKFLETEKKGLVIVPTTSLVEQLYSDFKDYSATNTFDVEDNVHRVYSGYAKETDKPVMISTWQSLYQLPKEYFHKFDFVFGDEAHQFKSKSLIHIMTSLANAKYRIGLTGTLDGTKTHKLVLEGLFGPVETVTSTKKLMDQGHVSKFQIKALLLKHDDALCKANAGVPYPEEIKFLIDNDARNTFISNLAVSMKENTLVLFTLVEHGKELHRLIQEAAGKKRKVFLVYGKTETETREEVRKVVEKERNAIICASYGTFSTGINIRNLHNVIFASPHKGRIRVLQSIGRSLRLSDGKEVATLYDIADDLTYRKKVNFTLKHFLERIDIYSSEKFKFKLYKINLKG